MSWLDTYFRVEPLKNRGIAADMNSESPVAPTLSAPKDDEPDYSPLPLHPLRDIVWLVHEKPAQLSSSIWLPDESLRGDDNRNSAVWARVVAVGPGRILKNLPALGRSPGDYEWIIPEIHDSWVSAIWRAAPLVKVGDRVLVGRHEGHDLEVMNRKVRVVIEEAIHAVDEDWRATVLESGMPR